jgi:hypothetical protein
MSFIKLVFKPGINRDQTNYSGEGGWWDGDKIRFFSGFPQKLGGWSKVTPNTFLGVCRQLWNWITSYTDNLLAVGTNRRVYIETAGTFFNITPIRTTLASPDTDDCISTVDGSNVVTFTIASHGCETGAFVTISGVTGDPGGILDADINKEHEVTRVSSGVFTITVSSPASSTVANPPGAGGSSISIVCEINPGNASVTAGYGWGVGTYGLSGWGLSSSTPIYQPQQDWFFDNFDNDLVMNIRAVVNASGDPVGGPIYYWERGSLVNPGVSLATRAILLSDLTEANSVPNSASQILVSQNDKHLLAFGCQPYAGSSTDYDPLLIRWASQDEPQYWNPTGVTPGGSASSAGFLRVSRGSTIIRGLATRQEILTWTDTTLYSLQYLGTTDVFSLQQLADNISIISPRAVTTANNTTYWMGKDKFYAYNGQVQTLPCTVREYVFKDLNFNQANQIVSGSNEEFTEIWWFYPSADSGWNNHYVIYNYQENIWYFGNIVRTAWLDTPLKDFPVAAYTEEGAESGYLYYHESSINDDGAPLVSYIQSNDFDLGEGDQFILTRRMLPDINYNQSTAATPTVTLTIRPRNFPGSQYQGDPSDTQNVIETSTDIFTNEVFIRARARQMALKISSDTIGVQWQLGSPRLDVRPDGRR